MSAARLLGSALILLVTCFSHTAWAVDDLQTQSGKWRTITIPDTTSGNRSVASLFGDELLIEDYGTTWTLFGWDAPNQRYTSVRTSTILQPGQGYWFVQITGSPVALSVPTAGQPAAASVTGCPSREGCRSVPLTNLSGSGAWNMVGYAGSEPLAFSDTRYKTTAAGDCAAGCTVPQAAVASHNLVYDFLWRYNGGYERIRNSTELNPWDGYWLATRAANPDPNLTWLLPLAEAPDTPQGNDAPDLANYKKVFDEEFNSAASVANTWESSFLWGPFVAINNEKQIYLDTNDLHQNLGSNPFVFAQSAGLSSVTITAEKVVGSGPPLPAANDPIWGRTTWTRNTAYDPNAVGYSSGVLTSYDSFKFTHGYVEARVRLPAGPGLRPALYLGTHQYLHDSPQIDILKYRGDRPGEIAQGYSFFDRSTGQYRGSSDKVSTASNYSRGWHTVALAWEPGQIIWYVDGRESGRETDANLTIPGQAMYLVTNLAVGGSNAPVDASTAFPAGFEIDYIKVYKKNVLGAPGSPVNLANYDLRFSDEFRGSRLDGNKWQTRFLWGPWKIINNEEQYYFDVNGLDRNQPYSPFTFDGENVTITAEEVSAPRGNVPPAQPPAADLMFLQGAADPRDPNNPTGPTFRDGLALAHDPNYTPQDITSGLMVSRRAFNFVNGYAEIRARVPKGNGLWPAFWLLNSYYVGPQPEIDIMEMRGSDTTRVVHSYHYNNGNGVQSSSFDSRTPGNGPGGFTDYADGFHTYAVQWGREEIRWYVDGQEVWRETGPKVSYQLMYVLVNLAVGGDFDYAGLDRSVLPAQYVIDYVRVYQEKDSP